MNIQEIGKKKQFEPLFRVFSHQFFFLQKQIWQMYKKDTTNTQGTKPLRGLAFFGTKYYANFDLHLPKRLLNFAQIKSYEIVTKPTIK